ncbi:MAG TPA: 50S ribosomal protein L11 methyltransferase [Solirubrobacteraceae bacterium]|jgi:ribosomal protein L11 methyltransferase
MIRLALRVSRADAEVVLADLLELATSGVEEIELPLTEGGQSFIEYAVYGAPGELPDLPDLRAAAGGALMEVSTSEVPDDWSERWKQFHQPVLVRASPRQSGPIGGGLQADDPGSSGTDVPALHVRPPWEARTDRANALEIVIDPAQAFGTGAHATTHMCLQLLLDIAATEESRGAVLDVGAGSGVLAIAAVKLGYGPVLALDNDRESVLATTANAAANGVEVRARSFDLRREPLPTIENQPAPIVLANLLKPLLIELSATIHSPPQHLIASGLLSDQADAIAAEFATRHSLRERRRLTRGEWAALWLTRD